MNIIIDARMINRNLHGIARYSFELIKGLAVKDDIKIKLLTNNEELTRDIFKGYKNIEYIKMKSKFLSPFEIIEFPIILNRYKKDHIFHSPSFSSSPFIRCKSFITIHDLNHLALPQYYSKFHKYYYKFAVKPFALRCEKIFTVSYFSKNEIAKWLKCDEDKIVVTYNGIDEKFRVIGEKEVLNTVRDKYNLPEKFVLYIGNLKQHKNVRTLVKAMSMVKKDVKLIINGKVNDELKKVINEYNLESRVQFIGYVNDEELPAIYNLANVFVFPSLYEGFGLPALEAISCGCKTIVSNSTCLPEVVGNCGVVVRNNSFIEYSTEINKIIEKNDYECEAIDKEKYNWNAMIRESIKQYKVSYFTI